MPSIWRPARLSRSRCRAPTQGDTTTIVETATAAAEQVEDAQADVDGAAGAGRDHRRQGLSQQSDDGRPRRRRRPLLHRGAGPRATRLVGGSPRPRRRCMAIVAGFADARGRRLMRRRGETIERSFAHLYDTGGMRRTHLRGHTNILKRLLIHAGGFNLGLVMRQLIGVGTRDVRARSISGWSLTRSHSPLRSISEHISLSFCEHGIATGCVGG